MEAFNIIVQMISSVGFPIVMCLILLKYIKDSNEKLTDAVNNNTLAIAKLSSKLGVDSDE